MFSGMHVFTEITWKDRLMNYLFSYGEYPFLQYQSVFLVKNCLDGFDQHVNLNEFKLKENHRVTEQGH